MDKKKRLLILIFVLILSGIVVIFIHKNGSMKGDSIMEENAISEMIILIGSIQTVSSHP